jgi:hypothetical protein
MKLIKAFSDDECDQIKSRYETFWTLATAEGSAQSWNVYLKDALLKFARSHQKEVDLHEGVQSTMQLAGRTFRLLFRFVVVVVEGESVPLGEVLFYYAQEPTFYRLYFSAIGTVSRTPDPSGKFGSAGHAQVVGAVLLELAETFLQQYALVPMKNEIQPSR